MSNIEHKEEVKEVKKEKKVKTAYTDEQIKEIIEKSKREDALVEQAEREKNSINQYASGSLLTDKSFLLRLHKMNVFSHWLPLFRDHDKNMTDTQIWEKIRFTKEIP